LNGGETEIRTLEGLASLAVFKTAAFNHSAISPYFGVYYIQAKKKSKYINIYLIYPNYDSFDILK
tara:strand:+ start:678 stop:872 length:195 start_codon:yes stop_codon:yes gene_type:complete